MKNNDSPYEIFNEEFDRAMGISRGIIYQSPLNIPEGKSGEFTIEHKIFQSGEKMDVISMRTAFFSGLKPAVALVTSPTKFHYLKKDGGTMMSDVPCEMYDHKEAFEKCKRKVLIGGLGLGYITKLLDSKKSVKEITTIEIEQDVIDLVWSHLNTNKSKIVKADLFSFLKESNEVFDYAYFDIWGSDGEYSLLKYVIPLRRLAKEHVKNEIICWKEKVMRGQLFTGLQSKIMLSYDKMLNEIKDEDFEEFHKRFDQLQAPFWRWVRTERPTKEVALAKIEKYAATVGDLDWEKEWNKYGKIESESDDV